MFIIIIGGILVIIIYITRTVSNEKFKINLKIIVISIAICLITIISLDIDINISISSYDTLIINTKIKNFSLNKFFREPIIKTTLIIISYLLVALVAIVKITEFKRGPLRQKT